MKTRRQIAGLAVLAVVLMLLTALTAHWPYVAGPGRSRIRAEGVTVTSGEERRSIFLCTPYGENTEPLPLVLAFHGIGGSPRSMQATSELDEWVGDGRCVVAFLEARRGMWATEGSHDAPVTENRDVRFVGATLDELPKHVRFDPSRVYAVGMSNGAIFAEMLALALPDRIAAAAGHSGALPPKYPTLKTGRRVPILLIAGEEDHPGMVDAVRATAAELRTEGHEVEVIVRPGLSHEWDTSQNKVIWQFLSRNQLRQ